MTHCRVAVGQVDDALRQPQHFGHLAGLLLGDERRERQPDRQYRIADRLEQCDVFRSQTGCLPAARIHVVRHHLPGHPDRQRPLITRGGAQVAQFVEAGVGATTTHPPRAAR